VRLPLLLLARATPLSEFPPAEQRALAQARAAFAAYPHDIAAFIAEPIQGEGGDNHLRPEFLSAMLDLTHAHDALFILDEVQTGVGTTGTPWAYQQLGVQPDVVAFAKKAQLGGIMAGGRVDDVPDNVFAISGRINSTWGGGLTDMVRCRRLLEIIESAGLIEAAGPKGARLVAGLESVAAESGRLDNVRGRGLFVACDLPDTRQRDRMVADLREKERVIVLPSGERSVRFRPALSVSEDEIDEAVQAVRRSAGRLTEVDA
jgi:L-lysine 6-transaminase